MHKPLVSVILPTFNRAYIVKRAIDSVLDQRYKNLELIIIDDCSTDNTKKVVQSYSDKRVKYIVNAHNLGGAGSRNEGIKIAKGAFIAFQDSDDEWLPQKLEEQISILDQSPDEIGAIYCNFHSASDQKIHIYHSSKKEGDIHQELLVANFITLPSLVVRKQSLKIVGLFDPDLPRLQDWDLLLRLSQRYKIGYTDKILLKTYFSPDSITAKSTAYTKALGMILDKYKEEFTRNKKIYAKHLFNLANNLSYEPGSAMKIKNCLLQAWKLHPAQLLYLFVFLISLFGRKPYNYFLRNYKKTVKMQSDRL